jgi:hypothetical protein
LLLEFLKRSSIINSQQKVQTLKKLKQWIWGVQPTRNMNQILLLNDNAILHTNLCTRDATATVGRPFCSWWRAETQSVTSSIASVKSFTQVSFAKVEKVCWQWKRLCGKILSNLKSMHPWCTHMPISLQL